MDQLIPVTCQSGVGLIKPLINLQIIEILLVTTVRTRTPFLQIAFLGLSGGRGKYSAASPAVRSHLNQVLVRPIVVAEKTKCSTIFSSHPRTFAFVAKPCRKCCSDSNTSVMQQNLEGDTTNISVLWANPYKYSISFSHASSDIDRNIDRYG